MRGIALIVRAGAVVCAFAFVLSLLVHGAPKPAIASREAVSASTGPTQRDQAHDAGEEGVEEARGGEGSRGGRRDRRDRGHRDGIDAEPAARRGPVVLLGRPDRPRGRRGAREPRGHAVDGRELEVRGGQHELLRVPHAALVRQVARARGVHGDEPREQPRLRLRRGGPAADDRRARSGPVSSTPAGRTRSPSRRSGTSASRRSGSLRTRGPPR